MKKKNTVIITQQFFSVDSGDGSKKYLLLVETEGNKIIQVGYVQLPEWYCQRDKKWYYYQLIWN